MLHKDYHESPYEMMTVILYNIHGQYIGDRV